RLRAAAELVTLDEALKALALAGAGHIDELARGEDLGLDLLSRLNPGVIADLHDVPVRFEVCLLELAQPRAVEPAFLDRSECDAHSLVAVLLGRAQAKNSARARLEHRHRGGRAIGVEKLGHAQLFGQETFHDLISMFKPPGTPRSSREPTTLGLG